jgi:hypothetical protein
MLVPLLAIGLAPDEVTSPPQTCDATQVEYALAANLQLSDTPMGEGNGVYAVGPGRAVVRFDNRDGQPTGGAKLLSYDMNEKFKIDSKTLFWKTHVTVDNRSRATPDRCGVAASGTMSGGTLTWSTPVNGYHTDGTISCDGSLCGKAGAPPSGSTPLHIGPGPVQFEPFVFAADQKTFTMASAYVGKTEMPKQTAHLTLSGREVSRRCVAVKPCE